MSLSILIEDFIFLWKQLSANNTLSLYSDLAKQCQSSTNLYHSFTLSFQFGITDFSSYVNKVLPENVKVETAYIGKRLSSYFKTKAKAKFEHQNDIIHQLKCSAENCLEDYIGEPARHVIERVKYQGGRDTKSYVLKHSIENEHVEFTQKDFR